MEDVLQSIERIFINKLRNKSTMWKKKSLPLVARMIFIRYDILTMFVYQSSIVLAPKGAINDMERIFKKILWWRTYMQNR